MNVVTKTSIALIAGGAIYLYAFDRGRKYAMENNQGDIQAAARKLVREAGDKVLTERYLQRKYDASFKAIVGDEK